MACADDLAEARAALKALVTGQAVASISFEGEQTTFRRTDLSQLRAYIRDLEAECGEDTTAARRRPARVVY